MEILCRSFIRSIGYINKQIFTKTIMTTTTQCNKIVEELEKNPYFEKYAEKIAKLQQTSPEELLSRYEHKEKNTKHPPAKERQFTSLLQPKKELERPVDVNDEPLDKIMKTDLIKDKSIEEIKEIWEKYHINKEIIAATIPTKEYDIIMEQSKKYPIFLFALPRSQGYEFIMSEFRGNTIHFTPLICYQVSDKTYYAKFIVII